ncbi:hypothetical protein V6N11_026699 [Hibiscus sabdariffa]|uniref:B-like cyclin n=1 Tax=Hibiscus sabdariffa TaxID=183260 RepID=A0ABR2SXA4_9ROSI
MLQKKMSNFWILISSDYLLQLNRRPSTNYMEQVQKDITPSMRGILIDWLVEVSEEYKLVPDTLYLTVSLVDRFLSHNFIEKQRLQLLGVTCMLIASNLSALLLRFEGSTKRFAHQEWKNSASSLIIPTQEESSGLAGVENGERSSEFLVFSVICSNHKNISQVPCMELEFLANYLAELSLVEYNFLKFLPSLIAASAVFLARWTLNQSVHPWNPTLEHYTSYKATELENTVLALEELQLNTNGCSLSAIRDKYRQQKAPLQLTFLPQQQRAHNPVDNVSYGHRQVTIIESS